MNEQELSEALDEIRAGMRWYDGIIRNELSDSQRQAVKGMFDLFKALNWQVKLNSYKQTIIGKSEPILTAECGTPVKIRPVGEEYEGKTFFGILIGDVSVGISQTIDTDGNLIIERSSYNPAILVPELGTIIYGYESWWGEIGSEDELQELITDDVIKNVWYVKMLKGMAAK